jgi:U4/U6.U5 tri-snRNP component SNU23
MAAPDQKANAYNTTTSDTSFRKTWNRAEYAEKAAERAAAEKAESKARYEAKASGRTYHSRAATPPDAKESSARAARLDVASNVGKTMLVGAGAAVGKRGRGAGFWCEACDLTFKDSVQWVEHLNSRGHRVAVGESGEVRRVGIEEVRDRLAWLKRKRDEVVVGDVVDLRERLRGREEEEERLREERRTRRREKRRDRAGGGIKEEGVVDAGIIC